MCIFLGKHYISMDGRVAQTIFILKYVKVSSIKYDRFTIPSNPKSTLKVGQIFRQTDRLEAGSMSLILNKKGNLQIQRNGLPIFTFDNTPSKSSSPIYSLYFNNSNLQIRDSVEKVKYDFCTSGLNGTELILLETGAYNREYGLVMVNYKRKMVWGRFGPLTSTVDTMIPGSYIDSQDKENNKLEQGDFITNGRDYLRMERDGVLMMYLGNPNGDTNGSPSVFSSSSQFYKANSKYVMNLENGTMVFYSNDTANPIIYREHLHSDIRFLHLPNPDPTYSKAEWSILGRDSNGKIVWGHFNHPTQIVNHPFSCISQRNPNPNYNYPSINGSYLIMEANPKSMKFIDFYCKDANISISTTPLLNSKLLAAYHIKTPGTLSAKSYGKVSLGFTSKSGQFFGVWNSVTPVYGEILYITDAPHVEDSNFYFFTYNQIPALVILDCKRKLCGIDNQDTCGCQHVWSQQFDQINK
ncbi:hypothetical protein PPL_03605 [Heterostelium album PN500]|uniref:Uncharacterized protein n=1 Tax=Heterostelium pallidum (strain ATCC 26659 / Pp 5 / PN500) TaxID=670386 RepID=D3B592_HETP5|nr:hypothetical protein PPL_03605 [Heterostelium album PN500]EFA83457.1 hypothetical protein PPL_03605 [Heterostelium album PN500]|eukprot:XP_020435574.1 hypothetical protein PPL_03605 [Heterostelium album PN500]